MPQMYPMSWILIYFFVFFLVMMILVFFFWVSNFDIIFVLNNLKCDFFWLW